jgi:hypothetical protein
MLPGAKEALNMSLENVQQDQEPLSGGRDAGVGFNASENPVVAVDEAKRDAEISVELLHKPEDRKHFRVPRDFKLLEVLDEGAEKLSVKLLPNLEKPLDHLRGIYENHHAGEPLNLELTLEDSLREQPSTHHFAVDLVLAIQINTRWRIAPEKEMTPKAILALAELPWQEYSLYYPADSVVPLPPDTPVKLDRGQRFEAQRDGKYGAGVDSAHRNR